MTKDQIIRELKGRNYFQVRELVCNHVLSVHKEGSWRFLDKDYLHTLLIIRHDILKVPMVINAHHSGVYQRGARCNLCKIVKEKKDLYIGGHVLFKAGDATPLGMTAAQARRKIIEKQHLLPVNIRLEDDVHWLHFDTLDWGQKVYLFKP